MFFPFDKFFAVRWLPVFILWAISVFALRKTKWSFAFWLPLVIYSFFGTLIFFAGIVLLFQASGGSGEAYGFLGMGALILLTRTVFYPIALVCCFVGRPKFFYLPAVIGSSALCLFFLVFWIQKETRIQPIIIMDERGEPLKGITINSRNPESIFNGSETVKTDESGLATLRGFRGQRFEISPQTELFYVHRESRHTTVEFKNNANAPLVFHLKKKGEGVDLITSAYGIRPDFPISIPRDGTPIKVDFMNRKVGNAGQMQLVEKKPEYKDWKKADAWSFQMEIPDGGFVEQNDEFPFEAPESGYKSTVQFDFHIGESNWTTDLKKDYYIRFGNPPRYGRLRIQTGISYGGAILTYAINPDGSRYLEPKSNE